MSLRPSSSRSQLMWKQFSQKADGSWCLNLPPYYAGLFQSYFPSLMKKSNTGFRESKSRRTKYAFFPTLESRDIERIESFQKFFERAVCLSTSFHLRTDFSDELDFC